MGGRGEAEAEGAEGREEAHRGGDVQPPPCGCALPGFGDPPTHRAWVQPACRGGWRKVCKAEYDHGYEDSGV